MLVVTLNKGLFCLSAMMLEFSVCGVSDGYLTVLSRIILPELLKKKSGKSGKCYESEATNFHAREMSHMRNKRVVVVWQ